MFTIWLCKNRNNCRTWKKFPYFCTPLKTPNNEGYIHHSVAYCIQHIHDLCLVLTITWDRPQFQGLAAFSRHPDVVGRRLVRVFLHDSCQPHRCDAKRRPFQPYSIESHPRSRFLDGIHHHRDYRIQDGNLPLEPYHIFHLHHPRRVFCLQKVVFCCKKRKNAWYLRYETTH